MSSPSGKYFAPKPGRFGKHPIFLVGPAGVNALATFTASDTTKFDIPTPYRKLYFEKAAVHARTVPGFDAAGTNVATVFRVRSGTATPITASLSVSSLATTVTPFVLLTTASANAFYINEGDHFQVQISLTDAVSTSAADMTFVIEAGVLE